MGQFNYTHDRFHPPIEVEYEEDCRFDIWDTLIIAMISLIGGMFGAYLYDTFVRVPDRTPMSASIALDTNYKTSAEFITLRNGQETMQRCVITGDATVCNDQAHPVRFKAGDQLAVKAVPLDGELKNLYVERK